MRCKICNRLLKENTDGNMRYCQGHTFFEVEKEKDKAIANKTNKKIENLKKD